MGSKSRRSRKVDRNRQPSAHASSEEERKRIARDRKREWRARRQATIIENPSPSSPPPPPPSPPPLMVSPPSPTLTLVASIGPPPCPNPIPPPSNLEAHGQVESERAKRNLQKPAIRRRANRIIHTFFHDLSPLSQSHLLTSLIDHPDLVKCRELAGLGAHRERRASSEVLHSVRSAYASIKRRNSADALAARRAIVAAISRPHMVGHMRATSRLLSIASCTLKRGSIRRESLDVENFGSLWAWSGRAPRSDRLLDDNTRSWVEKFWEENCRVSPVFKKALRKRVAKGVFIEHGACYLEITQTELYAQFVEAYPNFKIGQRSFERCKPWFVRYSRERDTCCCRYHVDFQLFYDVFRSLSGHKGMRPISPRDFIHSLLCPREDDALYHHFACVEGRCDACGNLSRLPIVEEDASDIEIVRWRSFEYITHQLDGGGTSRRLQIVERQTPRVVFIATFRDRIYPYIQHTHTAKWQDRQFHACLAKFPLCVIVSVVDFAENYTFAPQHEIQSEYYFSEQVAIMVHISYRHAELHLDGVDSTLDTRVIIREYHFYISDDRSHDAHFVQHSFSHHDAFLRDRGVTWHARWIWSDGCGSQFKSARQFFWLCRWHLHTSISVIWNFFETGHGKGEHDGAGACVKRALRRHQLSHAADRFRDAKQVVDWCTAHLSSSASSFYQSRADRFVRRFFWCVDGSAIDRSTTYDCRTVPGTSEFHSIRSVDRHDPTIFTRCFACFCEACIDGDWGDCALCAWVDPWSEQVLSPYQLWEAPITHQEDRPMYTNDYDQLTDLLQIDDIFAVIAPDGNEEGVDYYLLRCSMMKSVLNEDIVDGHGIAFDAHSMVIGGFYFQQVQRRGRVIEFQQYMVGREAYIYSHLVIAIKLRLDRVRSRKATSRPRWKLSVDDHESILDVLRMREGADE